MIYPVDLEANGYFYAGSLTESGGEMDSYFGLCEVQCDGDCGWVKVDNYDEVRDVY
jgi:hypothetical protein